MKEQTKRKKQSNKRKFFKSEKDIKIALIVVVIIFAFVIYKIFDLLILNNENYDLSGETYYQYFFGVKQEYSGKMNLIQQDDDMQLILEDGKVINLDSTPMYYRDTLGKALLAQEMELVIPDDSTYKLKKFTNVIEENNQTKLKRLNHDNEKNIDKGFIYDGNDLYFFLNDTTVTVGNTEYELPALSYVIVNYQSSVEIYNYEKDEYTIIQDENLLQSDVIATNKAQNYTINMSLDSLKTEKNSQLLISNINNLNEYEYK